MSERLVGNYRILERIGQGGMGTVYRAIDVMLEREVALKILRPDLAGQPDVEARFRDEAVTLARLNHPNIAVLYSLVREGEELFMVMEFVKGESLESILARSGAVDAPTSVAWCCQVLDAMEYAHRKGVVHRDLKPANLMLTETGLIKVTDFGIARVLGGHRRTRDGRIIGTIAYMSPEQVHGQDVDGRSDIYSLGTVLYELVTGRVPFEAADEFDLMCAQINEPPVAPHVRQPGVPEWLSAAVLKALAKAPGDRHQTAAAFREVLHEGLQSMDAAAVAAGGGGVPDRVPGAVVDREVKPTRVADPGALGDFSNREAGPSSAAEPTTSPHPDSDNHLPFLDAILKLFRR